MRSRIALLSSSLPFLRSGRGASWFALLVVASALVTSGCAPLGILPRRLSTEERYALGQSRVTAAVRAADNGNTATADRILAEALGYLEGDGTAYSKVGKLLLAQQRPALAVRLLREAVKRKGIQNDPRVWAALAEAQKTLGEKGQAAESSLRAETLATDILKSRGQMSPNTTGEMNREAIPFLQAGLYYADDKKEIPNALLALEEAARLSPNNPIALNACGYMLADKGTTRAHWENARKLTRRAVQLAPDEPIILDSFGWSLYRLGDLAGARRVLREAVDGAPAQPEILYHLGIVYADLKMYDDAARQFERALVLDAKLEAAKKARAALPEGIGSTTSETTPATGGASPLPAKIEQTVVPNPSRAGQSPTLPPSAKPPTNPLPSSSAAPAVKPTSPSPVR